MDSQKDVLPGSPVYSGSCLNQRTFDENESCTSLQSTILAGQLSFYDETPASPRKKSLTTVEEDDDENDQNPLDLNLDAISDDEVFYECADAAPVPERIPVKNRLDSEEYRVSATATKIDAVEDGCSSNLCPLSAFVSSVSTAFVTGEQGTISPSKLSGSSLYYKSHQNLMPNADSGIGDDKTSYMLFLDIQNMKSYPQSTPKFPDDVDFSSGLAAATCTSSIYSSLTQPCDTGTVAAVTTSLASDKGVGESDSKMVDKLKSMSIHSASTMLIEGPRSRSRLAASSSSPTIGLRLDSPSNTSTNSSSTKSSTRPRRNIISFNTSRKSGICNSSIARLSVTSLKNRNQRRSSGSSTSSGSLRPCSADSSSGSSNVSASSSSLRSSTSDRSQKNSCSPISNRLPQSPFITRRKYGPPRSKLVPQLANFYEQKSRSASSTASSISSRSSRQRIAGLNQSRGNSSTVSSNNPRKITFHVFPEVKLRRSSPRKAFVKAPSTPYKARKLQQEITSPASKTPLKQLNSTQSRSRIPVHIESARKRAVRAGSVVSGASRTHNVSNIAAKNHPVAGGCQIMKETDDVIANAAAKLKPVYGVPFRQRLKSANSSVVLSSRRTPTKKSPEINQSSIVKRRSRGLVSSPIKSVRQLRKMFSPAAGTRKSPAKRPNNGPMTATGMKNSAIKNRSSKKIVSDAKTTPIPRIVITNLI